MQNRYVGDIGDYIKYALLRALCAGRRLSVAWYLYPDESHNNDGKHVKYLDHPEKWQAYDKDLFDALSKIVKEDKRNVSAVADSGLLGDTVFSEKILDADSIPIKKRKEWRESWFAQVLKETEDSEVVFADPDNGLCEDNKFNPSRKKDWKRLPLKEALLLGQKRTAILYHHNTMFKGGHGQEIQYWFRKLPFGTIALYCRAFSCRTFFVLNPSSEMRQRAKEFADRWGRYVVLVE